MSTIALARTDREIQRCFSVMAELRPHLDESEFVARVRTQQREGFELAFLSEKKQVKAVAGFRVGNNLAWGNFLYVDDLVTAENFRSQGHGQKLFDWLVRQARSRGCDEFHLDSGVQRFGAHRFYLARRMDIIAHHFALKLP
jgi:GNAT superfamily N-acetyltransferase